MESKKTKLYLYLARRDRSNIKVLTTFPGPIYPATRVKNIEDLKLPLELEKELSKTIRENRMLWEVWIEGAENYDSLRESLIARGYRNVPGFHSPQHAELAHAVTKKKGIIVPSLESPMKTMTRRASHESVRSLNVSTMNKKTTRVNLDEKTLAINIRNDSPIFKKINR